MYKPKTSKPVRLTLGLQGGIKLRKVQGRDRGTPSFIL